METGIVEFIAQGAATLLGALAAFELERQRQKREEHRVHAHELREALFALAVQRSFLLNVKQQVLDPHREDPHRTLAVRPTSMTPPPFELDVASLGFVLKDGAELLQHLVQADIGCRNVVMAMGLRNSHYSEFQKRVEPVHLASGKPEASFDEIYRAAGPNLWALLEDTTEALFRMTDSAVAQNGTVNQMARAYFARRFPREKLFKVEDVPPSDPVDRVT